MSRTHVLVLGGAAAVVAAVLTVGIVWSALTDGDVVTAMALIAARPWGLVTLVDLFAGLALTCLWAGWVEGPRRAWPWWLAFFILGNAATALYVLWRCRRAPDLRSVIMGSRQ